jgi:hypothetical protein
MDKLELRALNGATAMGVGAVQRGTMIVLEELEQRLPLGDEFLQRTVLAASDGGFGHGTLRGRGECRGGGKDVDKLGAQSLLPPATRGKVARRYGSGWVWTRASGRPLHYAARGPLCRAQGKTLTVGVESLLLFLLPVELECRQIDRSCPTPRLSINSNPIAPWGKAMGIWIGVAVGVAGAAVFFLVETFLFQLDPWWRAGGGLVVFLISIATAFLLQKLAPSERGVLSDNMVAKDMTATVENLQTTNPTNRLLSGNKVGGKANFEVKNTKL